jgi:hypothetical protein
MVNCNLLFIWWVTIFYIKKNSLSYLIYNIILKIIFKKIVKNKIFQKQIIKNKIFQKLYILC